MAMYQPDHAKAASYLDKAEVAAKEGKNSLPAMIKQESAQILRARIEVGLRMDDQKTTRTALARLSDLSRNSSDKVIDSGYHGAAGAVLFSEHKYTDAISHLEEDILKQGVLRLRMSITAADRATRFTELLSAVRLRSRSFRSAGRELQSEPCTRPVTRSALLDNLCLCCGSAPASPA